MSFSRAIGGPSGAFDLHPLCASGDLKSIINYWNRLCDQVELRKGEDLETPLHVAARTGQHEVLNYLLSKQANINSRDAHGRTPLHLAALNSQLECQLLLVKHGAQLNAEDNAKMTPLHMSDGPFLRLISGEGMAMLVLDLPAYCLILSTLRSFKSTFCRSCVEYAHV